MLGLVQGPTKVTEINTDICISLIKFPQKWLRQTFTIFLQVSVSPNCFLPSALSGGGGGTLTNPQLNEAFVPLCQIFEVVEHVSV